jgi:hypothetical protein
VFKFIFKRIRTTKIDSLAGLQAKAVDASFQPIRQKLEKHFVLFLIRAVR